MIACLYLDFSPDCAGCGYKQAMEETKFLIVEEMNIARSEGERTSRLTSLYNKLSEIERAGIVLPNHFVADSEPTSFRCDVQETDCEGNVPNSMKT